MIRIKLREAMKNHHRRTGERMTYKSLAQLTGLSRQTLESVASRPNYNSTLDTIGKLCHALGCKPGDLLVLGPDGPDEH